MVQAIGLANEQQLLNASILQGDLAKLAIVPE